MKRIFGAALVLVMTGSVALRAEAKQHVDFYTATVTASSNPNVHVGQTISGEFVFSPAGFFGNAVLPDDKVLSVFTEAPTAIIEDVNLFFAISQAGVGLEIISPPGVDNAPGGFPIFPADSYATGDFYRHGQTVAFDITSFGTSRPTPVTRAKAPELDPTSATAALTLMLGGLAVAGGSRRLIRR